jgi:hypothetical protein
MVPYSVFQGSANGGLILSSSYFLILPQLPQKMKLTLKVVKVDSKIIISLPKSLKLAVCNEIQLNKEKANEIFLHRKDFKRTGDTSESYSIVLGLNNWIDVISLL